MPWNILTVGIFSKFVREWYSYLCLVRGSLTTYKEQMISINHRLIHRHDSSQCLRERVCSYLRKFLRFPGTTSRNFHFTIYCQLTSSFLIYDSMFQNNGKTSIADESLDLAICPATLRVSSLLWVPEGRMRCYQNRLIFSFRVLCWCAQSFERFGGGGDYCVTCCGEVSHLTGMRYT